MKAEAEYNGKKGIWRTVSGRKIFIAEGEDLKTAMKNSGKFNSGRKVSKSKGIDDKVAKYYDEKEKAALKNKDYSYSYKKETIAKMSDDDLRKYYDKSKELANKYDSEYKQSLKYDQRRTRNRQDAVFAKASKIKYEGQLKDAQEEFNKRRDINVKQIAAKQMGKLHKMQEEELNQLDMRSKMNLGKTDGYGNGRKSTAAEVEFGLKNGEFTASGAIWNSRHTDWISGGQNLDELAEKFKGNKDMQELHGLWKKYHLNHMHAGTEAQEKALNDFRHERESIRQDLDKKMNEGYKYIHNEPSNYDIDVELLKRHNLYEDNGYKYGTAWLKRSIPLKDLKRIRYLLYKYKR